VVNARRDYGVMSWTSGDEAELLGVAGVMSITHERIALTERDPPVIFGTALHGIACSVCAPGSMSEAAVVAFMDAERPDQTWRAVDLAALGLGERTPQPCNQVAGRRHWLLLVRLEAPGSTS
jgi:hypothetical protein